MEVFSGERIGLERIVNSLIPRWRAKIERANIGVARDYNRRGLHY